MTSFDLIIFDMDGLLIDSERVAFNIYLDSCKRFGIEADHQLYFQCIGANSKRAHEILRTGLSGQLDYDAFAAYFVKQYDARIHQGSIPLKEGVLHLLKSIQSKGLPMAVATSTETQRALKKLKGCGIYQYFDEVTGGDQVTKSKPEPDIYLKTAEKFNTTPAKCLALEDSENGVKSAIAAGMQVVQIPDLIQPSESLRKLGHLVLGSLQEVVDYRF